MTKSIKIKTKTVYEAEDGAQFESMLEATVYQIKCDIRDSFEAVQPSATLEDYRKLVAHIWHNRAAFINSLHEADALYEQTFRDDSLRKVKEEEEGW